jgi:hypothetical protein
MHQENPPRQHDSRRKFLRVAGCLWLAAVLVIVIGALTAPYIGRMVDFVLSQTTSREWVRLTLRTQQPFFDLSSPERTVKSYYSALYRSDAEAMHRLTAGPFRDQMQLRVTHAQSASDTPTYRSFLLTQSVQDTRAVVVEKFHLFWQRGLRFSMQRHNAHWRIDGVDLIR